MNGIVINIDPVFFRIAHIEIRWYSVALLAAITVAMIIAVRLARGKGIKSDDVLTVAVWSVVAGIIGARLFHVVDHLHYYIANPAQIFQFQGLAIWGGLATGIATGVVVAWRKNIPIGKLADVAAPALLAAQIIGRFGCIVNGDAYGAATTLPWGFIYVNPDAMIPSALAGIPTHPYPVYEMLWNGGTLLLLMTARRFFKSDGQVFLGYVVLYSIGRLLLSFVRLETEVIFGLQQAQILAIACIVVAGAAFLYLQFGRNRNETVIEAQSTSGGGAS